MQFTSSKKKAPPFWLNSTGKSRSAIDFYALFGNSQREYNTNSNLEDLYLLILE